jgi:hypothetical protein
VIGFKPYRQGQLSVAYVVGLSLADSVLLVALILILLHAHGERPREVLFGTKAAHPRGGGRRADGADRAVDCAGRARRRTALPPVAAYGRTQPAAGAAAIAARRLAFRAGRDRRRRHSRRDSAGVPATPFRALAGRRNVGVICTSVAFGAGHLLQGADAALATGLLGAFWGVVYLWRRSCVAPMVSHAGFDLIQILQFLVVRRP